MEDISNLNLNIYTCSPRDIIKLCEFAREATNLDDEFSKGMRTAFDYIIKCMEVSEPVYNHMKEIVGKERNTYKLG